MNNHHLQLAGVAGPRVDGVDLDKLLLDLGEASATTSAVDLFGLCLNAQRVLERIHAAIPIGRQAETSQLGGAG